MSSKKSQQDIGPSTTPSTDEESSVDDFSVSDLLEHTERGRDRGQRTVISVGGGRGGVGRSTLAANLGLYFARNGRSVSIADLDPAGPALHAYVGLNLPVPTPIQQCARVGVRWDRLAGTQLQLCAPSSHFVGYDMQSVRRQLVHEVMNCPSDIILLDLGRAQDGISLDLFLEADVAITMSRPEPVAMEQAYAFIRAALFRHLVHGNSPAAQTVREVLTSPKGEAMPTFRGIIELLQREAPNDCDDVKEALADFVPGIILNGCASRADREMLRGMVDGMHRRWSIDAIPLGALDFDDVALQSSKWRRPLLTTYPGAAISKGIEEVGSAIMSLFGLEAVRL